MAAVNAAARAGDIVVAAAGTPPGEILKGWDTTSGSECLLEFGFSCMGHEIPAALGVRLARGPGSEIFVVIGDGTYLLMNTELVTAVQEGLKITVVIIDNNGFQCIRDLQAATTGTANFANEFRARDRRSGRLEGDYLGIDHALNAQSLGCWTARAESADDLRRLLAEARAQPRPAVIVCPADRRRTSIGVGAWWDLGIAAASERAPVKAIREAHEQGRQRQIFYG